MTLTPITRNAHAQKKFKPPNSFAFARKLTVVRIIANEASLVAQNCPIAFISEKSTVVPVAVLGLGKDENLFVSPQGRWLGSYVPAFLRRYPFYMGRTASGAPSSDDLVVMIEDQFLSDDEGEPLFGPDKGEPSGPLARAIQLLTEIAVQEARTTEMAKILYEQSLLDPLPLQVTRGMTGAGAVNLSGLLVVNESRLNGLPDEQFLALRQKGALSLAYAHLVSLGQFGRLKALADDKLQTSTFVGDGRQARR